MRQRGERIERSFAHVYDTGGMRRTHLKGHANISKRLMVHVAAFNLGLILRKKLGAGTPRGLWDRLFSYFGTLTATWTPIFDIQSAFDRCRDLIFPNLWNQTLQAQWT